jgi:hypothetical protein
MPLENVTGYLLKSFAFDLTRDAGSQ